MLVDLEMSQLVRKERNATIYKGFADVGRGEATF